MKTIIKETKICDCGAPLHWTFLFDGAEYYCMNCRNSAGMLGAGKYVEITPEIRAMQKVAGDVFKALRKHLLGSGRFTRTNCKKCVGNVYHTDHLTKSEVARNKIAQRIMNGLKGKII